MNDTISSQSAENNQEKIPSRVDTSALAFSEKLEERKKELVERLEKLRSEKVSPGNPQLDERANSIMQGIIKKQIEELNDLKIDAEARFKERAKTESQSLDTLADEILKDVTEKGSNKVKSFELTVDRLVKDKFVVTSEVYDISQVLTAISELEKNNPALYQVFQKLQENKELVDDDFKTIINSLNPYNIEQQRHDSTKSFEATGVGACIRIMRPDQRYKLVEMFMDPSANPQKFSDGIKLLEALLSTGQLTRMQGNELFQKAVKAGLITQDEFEKTYKSKLEENGEYQRKTIELQKVIDTELQKEYAGQYADNVMNRVVGKPAVGALMAVWGFMLVLMNGLANKSDLKSLAKNPYFYAGLAGMGVGTEMMTGTMKKGASTHFFGTVGGGVVSRAFDSVNDNESTFEREQRQAREKLEKLYPSMSPLTIEYLKQPMGGYETVVKLRETKEQEGKMDRDLVITIDELLKAEESVEAKEKLTAMESLKESEQEAIVIQLNQVAEIAPHLHIESPVEFQKLLNDIDSTQRPVVS